MFPLVSIPPAACPPVSPEGAEREILCHVPAENCPMTLHGLWDKMQGPGRWGTGPSQFGLCGAWWCRDPHPVSSSHVLCIASWVSPFSWWSSLWSPPSWAPTPSSREAQAHVPCLSVALGLDGSWQIWSVLSFGVRRKQRLVCAGVWGMSLRRGADLRWASRGSGFQLERGRAPPHWLHHVFGMKASLFLFESK